MTDTPRSRSISRASTPGLARSPPSRFAIPPSLRPSPSLSNLHIHSHNLTPSQMEPPPPLPKRSSGDHVLDSSASSVIGLEPDEGILVQDIDADVDHTDVEDLETIDKTAPAAHVEDSKKRLRDQLRKSLTHKAAQSEIEGSRSRQGKPSEVQDIILSGASLYLPREYFVLTDAGKPVFISRPGGGDQDGMASTIGIIQALISVFLDDNDKLRSINAGKTRITFLLRPPLYYACVSSWGEPESVQDPITS
ncbi:hypothetical protein M413DRAFT_444155 [Hebeloma cylindrosporum]|uniref:Vacuolar fusion protein MON1 n=1 Tax=Hebeloma cylindrosporum TaxID=76867 RepID=A0A0C3C343_HEBCY|nr:hypothetical protein M413DRAFT_444155 [Hebeloma cylindrosporum h7]